MVNEQTKHKTQNTLLHHTVADQLISHLPVLDFSAWKAVDSYKVL